MEIKITEVENFLVKIPFRRVHKSGGNLPRIVTGRRYVISKVKTNIGIEGLGEAPAKETWGGSYGVYYGESPNTVLDVINEFLAPAIRGESPLDMSKIHEKMDRAVIGYPYAKACIDIALYDIVGTHLNIPVYDLLGGCFRNKIPLAHSLGLMPTEDAVKEAVEAVKEGVRTIKVKVSAPHRDPALDINHIMAIREAISDKINLTIDANQGWSPQMAIKTIKKLERYNILFAEQPTKGIRNMARVKAAVDTPIMADESVWTQYDVLEVMDKEAADFISLYWTKPGGLYRAMKMAAVAETAEMPCNVNGSIEMGVGNSANLHLAAAAEPVTHACVIPVTNLKGKEQNRIANVYYLDDIITEPFKYDNGYLIVPNKPGLGINIDEEKLEQYRVN